ncbi:MAG: sulfurtransferase TusA family protein [Acidiferrobacteraceae bacterium]
MKPHAEIVDARRLLCPMPVIRAQERIGQLAPGDRVEILCSDPGALHDIPAWCRLHGHTVLSTVTKDDEIRVTVRVGPRVTPGF